MSLVFLGCKNPRFVYILFPCAWPLPSRSTLPFLLFHAPATYTGRRKLPFEIRDLLIFMLSLCLKVQTDPEEVKQRDLWVTDFIPMQNIYKLALALTSKEIGNLIYQSFCTMYQYRPRRRGTLLFRHLNAYRSFRHK